VLPQSISKRKRARVTNQYHNPLAVEPESAKDAARKITASDFLANAASIKPTAQAER
jgi:hypothetical protein